MDDVLMEIRKVTPGYVDFYYLQDGVRECINKNISLYVWLKDIVNNCTINTYEWSDIYISVRIVFLCLLFINFIY